MNKLLLLTVPILIYASDVDEVLLEYKTMVKHARDINTYTDTNKCGLSKTALDGITSRFPTLVDNNTTACQLLLGVTQMTFANDTIVYAKVATIIGFDATVESMMALTTPSYVMSKDTKLKLSELIMPGVKEEVDSDTILLLYSDYLRTIKVKGTTNEK